MAQIGASCNAIVNRARGLADIVNSQFATYNDLTSSLNESYKDLYEVLTDSSDDYFVKMTVLNVATGTANLNPNEYLMELPDDFYKLCYLDYNYNGVWQRMRKFGKDSRNNYASTPAYRFQGNNLWVIGGMWNANGFQIRMGYYPYPDTLYFPNNSFTFATGLTDIQKTTLQYPEYVPGNLPTSYPQDVNPAAPLYNGVFVVQQGTGILYISNQSGVVTTVLTSAADLKYPVFYRGRLYWVQDGDLYGSDFDPSNPAAVTGTQMTSTSDITWFDAFSGYLWFVGQSSTTLKSVAIPSTLGAVTGVAVTSPYTPPTGVLFYSNNFLSYPVWLNSAGAIYVNNVLLDSDYSMLDTDGSFLYAIKSKVLYRITVDMTTVTAPVISESEALASDVAWMSNPQNGYIAMIGYDSLQVMAVSTSPDYVITYPNNLAYEMMSYQIAMDIKRKQSADADLSSLQARYDQLHARFLDQSRRDDYYPDRISNNRQTGSPGGLFGVNF